MRAHVLITVCKGLIYYCHVFKMEANKKGEGGDFAALFSSDGSLNMAEFCEKISKRLANFPKFFRKLPAHRVLFGSYAESPFPLFVCV